MARLRQQRPDAAAVADAVLRLAVLLEAGVAPERAWRHLADGGEPVAQEVVSAGEDALEALTNRGGAWRDLGIAWQVAREVGAPLAQALRSIASAIRDAGATADEIRVALAEPVATARLMSWLPLVGLALGAALGFDTIAVAFTHPLGIACVAGGAVLVLCARRWSAVLVRRSRPAPGTPGLSAELLSVALAGGVSIPRARAVCAAAGIEADDETDRTLELSSASGAPARELLRAAAELARHRARTDGRLAAARLSSRLLLPLGVCTLPAFLLLGVGPMVLSVLPTTPLSL